MLQVKSHVAANADLRIDRKTFIGVLTQLRPFIGYSTKARRTALYRRRGPRIVMCGCGDILA